MIRNHLAIIGSGPSSIYLLKHLLDNVKVLKARIKAVSIFEKNSIAGMGMPYNPETTDRYNMSNISSEELPDLTISFADWLRSQDAETLVELGIEDVDISPSEVYPRLALGRYLNSQYRAVTAGLVEAGIAIHEHPGCQITDVRDEIAENRVTLIDQSGTGHGFDLVVVSTGHYWMEEDKPSAGFYASPWPIKKLLPEEGGHHDFVVGTLGASLSAFDVISSLAHRHGEFVNDGDDLKFIPAPGTGNFKFAVHSSKGMLPHLQFDQDEPFREIYRHIDRDGLLGMLDENGFLRIETFFNQVCRPALSKAFAKDNMPGLVEKLADPGFHLSDFAETMSDRHDYDNAFEGMRFEMVEARQSVLGHQPIHWKEVIDDLMYTLNFHAELMPAEDHLLFHSVVMPFLMNVIAAMPLDSGNMLLALYDAGKLEMIEGTVSIPDDQPEPGMTTVRIDNEGSESTASYRMFIDCSGQKPLELEEYPFPSLIDDGSVRKARAPFAIPSEASASVPEKKKEHLFTENEVPYYHTGGVDIDSAYRLIRSDGTPNPRIHDIAFPHVSGPRPYSYGLQACNHTAAIVVDAWIEEIKTSAPTKGDLVSVTELYEEL